MRIQDLKPCQACGEPIGFTFYRMRIEHHIVKPDEVRRHVGLATMLGSEMIAFAMGTDSDRSTAIARHVEVLLCTNCACTRAPLVVMESAFERHPELAAESAKGE